jgi:hypothetical protein
VAQPDFSLPLAARKPASVQRSPLLERPASPLPARLSAPFPRSRWPLPSRLGLRSLSLPPTRSRFPSQLPRRLAVRVRNPLTAGGCSPRLLRRSLQASAQQRAALTQAQV